MWMGVCLPHWRLVSGHRIERESGAWGLPPQATQVGRDFKTKRALLANSSDGNRRTSVNDDFDVRHLSRPELWIDTLAYFQEKHPGERCSLDALCERYQIQQPEGTNLDTLRDAKILGELYFKFSTSQ